MKVTVFEPPVPKKTVTVEFSEQEAADLYAVISTFYGSSLTMAALNKELRAARLGVSPKVDIVGWRGSLKVSQKSDDEW